MYKILRNLVIKKKWWIKQKLNVLIQAHGWRDTTFCHGNDGAERLNESLKFITLASVTVVIIYMLHI